MLLESVIHLILSSFPDMRGQPAGNTNQCATGGQPPANRHLPAAWSMIAAPQRFYGVRASEVLGYRNPRLPQQDDASAPMEA